MQIVVIDNMKYNLLNSLYLFALFIELLLAVTPLFLSNVQFFVLLLFVIYIAIVKIRISKAYNNWTMAYMAFFTISSLWAIQTNVSLYIITIKLLPIVVMCYSTITYVKKNRDISNILLVIYLSALFVLFYLVTHIEEFVIGVRLSESLNEEVDTPQWNSNSVGVCMCFALFSGFILFVNKKRHLLVKCIFFLSAIIMIAAILLTGSRKSFIILLIPLLLFICKRQKKHFLIFLIFVPVVALIMYELVMNNVFFYETIGIRIEETIAILTNNTEGGEDTSRITLVEFGLKRFVDNPILGVGINNFRVLSNQIYPGKNFYAHNNYIELLVGVGLLGLIIYYSSYIYIYKKLRNSKESLYIWGQSFLYILLFLGFVEVLYYEPLEQLILCMLFCMIELKNNKSELLYGKSF